MKSFIIYHNPRCSKSREALDLLRKQGIDPTVIEYLKSPLTKQQLLELRQQFDLKDFVRTSEPAFKRLELRLEDETTVLEAMLAEPSLMQRPIVVCDGHAIIARPPEKVLALINRS